MRRIPKEGLSSGQRTGQWETLEGRRRVRGRCYGLEGAGRSGPDRGREEPRNPGDRYTRTGVGTEGPWRVGQARGLRDAGWEGTAAIRGYSPVGSAGGCTRRPSWAGRWEGGPAGIRGARGAACARSPVRSRLSRVGPRTGRRDGRGRGAGGTRRPPLPKPGARPLAPPGGEWQGALARWVSARASRPGFKFHLSLLTRE